MMLPAVLQATDGFTRWVTVECPPPPTVIIPTLPNAISFDGSSENPLPTSVFGRRTFVREKLEDGVVYYKEERP